MKHKNVKRIISGAFAVAMVLSSIAMEPTIIAKAATAVKLKEGTKYTIVSRKSGKALAVENDSTSNNAKIVQKTLNNSDSQIWTLDYDDNGYYQIINEKSGKVLDVPNSSKKEGEAIIQWNKGNGNNQKWKISEVGSGYYRISPKTTSKYGLNVAKNSTNDNAKIQQWTYHGDANEQWEIREVDVKDTIRYEAEDAEVLSGAKLMSVPGASGGVIVGDLLDDYASQYVVYTGLSAGYRTMRIYYASAQDRKLNITIDGASGYHYYTVDCPSTGGWTTVGKPVEVQVYVEEGFRMRLGGDGVNYAPNVDYFEIVK